MLAGLHRKYPKLNFPQYEDILTKRNIVYAKSALWFDEDFYLKLGIEDVAVDPFMEAIGKALHRKEVRKKRAKRDNKENDFCWQESVEI